MAINLDTWVPQYIIEDTNDLGGRPIAATRWNELWLLHRTQGDNTAEALKAVLDKLNITAWHPTAGAASINNPALYPNGATEVSGQLSELVVKAAEALGTGVAVSNALSQVVSGVIPVQVANTLGGHAPAYFATAADLLALADTVENLATGAISAFPHNGLATRDAADAHPISSITGLTAALGTIPVSHAQLALRNAADSHPASAIKYSEALTVAQKFDAIDTTIASITGNVSEIAHNTLTLRDAASAHPTSAITGLDAALAGKQATITGAASTIVSSDLTANRALYSSAAGKVDTSPVTTTELGYLSGVTSGIQAQLATKQKQITASTSAPSGGSDGDVWIQYA